MSLRYKRKRLRIESRGSSVAFTPGIEVEASSLSFHVAASYFTGSKQSIRLMVSNSSEPQRMKNFEQMSPWSRRKL